MQYAVSPYCSHYEVPLRLPLLSLVHMSQLIELDKWTVDTQTQKHGPWFSWELGTSVIMSAEADQQMFSYK